MSRTLRAAMARPRLALAILVGGAMSLLVPSLFAVTVEAPSAVVLAAVTLALAAAVALTSRTATVVGGAVTSPPFTADEAPSVLAGRVTDPVHHPRRPRAPGRA